MGYCNFGKNFANGFMHGMLSNTPYCHNFMPMFNPFATNFLFNFNNGFPFFNNLRFFVPTFTSCFYPLMPEVTPPPINITPPTVPSIFINDNYPNLEMNDLFVKRMPPKTTQLTAKSDNTTNTTSSEQVLPQPKKTNPTTPSYKSQNATQSYVKSAEPQNDKYFDIMLKYILSQEGGYANDPLDRGGETNKGITKNTYDGYRRKKHLPIRNVREITDQEVREIYYEIYTECGADKIENKQIALMVFDVAVNSGSARAKKMYKECGDDIKKFEQLRRNFYNQIVKNRPNQVKFLKGWNNRVSHTVQFATANLPTAQA